MQGLMPIVKQAVVSGLIAQTTHRSRRADLAAVGFIILSGFVLVLAALFGALAAYNWLEQSYSEPAAFAFVGGALLFISATIFFIGVRILKRGDRVSSQRSQEEIHKMVEMLAEDIPEEIVGPIKDNPKTAMLAATVAGFLVGEKIH